MDELIRIGYGKADITPDESVPLGGYGNAKNRLSETVRDKLQATCIAFTDAEDNTVLLFTTDAIRAEREMTDKVRDVVCREHNLPRENVHVAATHTHSAPEMTETGFPSVIHYREKYVNALAEAARKAMADRLPGLISVGFATTENLNFIRHYKIADGTYAGANFGNWKPGVVGHASNNDGWVQVMKFDRIGGKAVLLVNFQAHPCFTGGVDKKVISADYIGELRAYLQTKTDARFAFFQGAAGNHNAVSFCARETRTNDVVEYARLLGDRVLKALEAPVPVKGGKVSALHRSMELPLDHSDDHKAEACRNIQAEWFEKYDRKLSNARAQEIGLNSIYAVNGVLMREKLPKTETMDIYAFRVGELGFACAPYEMFGASGMFIKEYAPYAMTFVVSSCNHAQAYLASDLAFSHGCYEVDTRRYPRGTAELLANTFVEMLTEQK